MEHVPWRMFRARTPVSHAQSQLNSQNNPFNKCGQPGRGSGNRLETIKSVSECQCLTSQAVLSSLGAFQSEPEEAGWGLRLQPLFVLIRGDDAVSL